MFSVIRSLIDFVAGIVGGVLRLITTFVSSCFGLVMVALIVVAVIVVAVLHLI